VSPAHTAGPIEMLFELWTRVGPGNHVLDAVQMPCGKGQLWRRKGRPIVKYRDTLRLSVQKKAESIKMPFGLWARMGPGKHVFAYGEE